MIEISSYSTFAEIPQEGRKLAIKYREVNPFVCDFWLKNFEQYLVSNDEQALYLVAQDEGRVIALFAFLIYHKSKLNVKKMRTMANFYTTFYSPLVTDGLDVDELTSALAKYIDEKLSDVTVIEYEPLRSGEVFSDVASKCREIFGYSVRQYPCHINRFESVEGDSFDTYWARRPSRLRNTLKRKSKALAKSHRFEIEIITESEGVSAAYEKFRLVYEQSWKTTESSPEFIHSVLVELANIGRAKLGILSVDGEPAAAQIWFRINEDWAVFKLAYREAYKPYSVGTILSAAVIESFFNGGSFKHLDFLSGDDSYKRDWMSQSRSHYGIEMINRRHLTGRVIDLKRKISRSSRNQEDIEAFAAD